LTTPITEIVVNSLITSPQEDAHVKIGRQIVVSGIAWDAGYGLSTVEISADGGKSWSEAKLGEDHGKYAFRGWSHEFTPKRRGKLSFAVRATNEVGQTQPNEPTQNPAGDHHNAIQTLTVHII
jgi:sulfite dehydrogenase (cytochrome) subunit A